MGLPLDLKPIWKMTSEEIANKYDSMLASEINWFKGLSELVDNYNIATTEFCCEMGLLRQDTDGSDSFTCCGSYGCGTNYSSQDIDKNCIIYELKTCERCELERPILLDEEYCEECLEKMEEELENEEGDDEDEDEEEEH